MAQPLAAPEFLGPSYWQHLGQSPSKPFTPLAWQAEAFQRISIPWAGMDPQGKPTPTVYALNCGRRAGKTRFAEKLLWKALFAPDDIQGPPTVRVTADTEEHGLKIWRQFIYHIQNSALAGLVEKYEKEYFLVTLVTGATAQLISANNPQALAGDGVTCWLVDEAQYLSRDAWNNMFPSTADRDGIIIMFGVSEGEGPFAEACRRGDSDDWPEYLRMVYPTAANPFVPRWRIEAARKILPPEQFKRLYLCQWAGETGKIFRNPDALVNHALQVYEHPAGFYYTELYKEGHDYWAGLDLGRLKDYSVHTIWNRQGRLVAWDRFNLVSWELQKARWYALDHIFHHPRTIVDSTGLGDPIFEDLLRAGMLVEGYPISTNARKRALIDEFAIRCGAGQIEIPEIPVLLTEMRHFEAKRSKSEGSNVILYTAPSGEHDDFILSAAFGTLRVPRPLRIVQEVDRNGEDWSRQAGPWEQIA